jgi:hypothetical protein
MGRVGSVFEGVDTHLDGFQALCDALQVLPPMTH